MMFLLRVAARLPLPLLHALGAFAGMLVYALSPRFRRHVRANLAQAGYRERTIVRETIRESGKVALELPAIWLRPQEQTASLVREVSGWDGLEQAMQARRGLILLTPHLGCWEVAAQYFSRHHPLTVLYRPPKAGWLDAVMTAGRTRGRLKSEPADIGGVRALYRALKRGEAIAMLPDQVPGTGEGEWTAFFDRPAYTMTLAMRMAESTGAPVMVAFAERLARGRGYRIHVEPLPQALPGETAARRVNRALEALIRRRPGQYVWAYNRYKVPAGVAPPGPAAHA